MMYKEDRQSIFDIVIPVTGIIILLALAQRTITAPEEVYHYPVEYFRYYETEHIWSSSSRQVEVIYKTDSETVKESFFTSNIKIGEKTEIVMHIQGDLKNVALYMTKDDYERLFSKSE